MRKKTPFYLHFDMRYICTI